jgi:hypothetical protein
MKTILSILLLAALATGFDLDLAAIGLAIVAVALMIGDITQSMLPDSACTQSCSQGDFCTCSTQKDKQSKP